MAFTSEPPNPKDYQDFEDYKKALKLHKDFIESAEKVSELLAENMSEEEERKAMEELGFTYHDDYICERKFCQEHGDCLSNMLEVIELSANENLFGDLLSNNDLIFPRDENNYGSMITCDDLPKNWFDPKSRENRIICLYMEIDDILLFDNLREIPYIELIEDKKIRRFAESLYFTLQIILRNKNDIKINEHKLVVSEFLKNNDVIDKKFCSRLLKKLKSI